MAWPSRNDPSLGLSFFLTDPFYWINPGVLVLIAVLPVLLLQVAVGLVFLCLQHRLRGAGVWGSPLHLHRAGILELDQLFIFE